MLMAPPVPHGVPWMQQPMPMMPVPYMPPTVEPHVAAQSSNAVEPSNTAEALQAGMTAQRKLSKIMKAVKKEDNLSPEFQQLVHTELKHEEKETTDTLLDAVKELGHAKDALLEVESARLQLWSQWRVFLQQSVIKWREYTTQFQTSEAAFFCQDARGYQYLEACTKKGRLGQKAHRYHWSRWCCPGDIRRRHGRAGAQGRRGIATGRKCTKNPRRIEPSCHKPGGSLAQCGEVGTQTQKATHQRGGRYCRATCLATVYAAFCEGRRAVTTEYDRQRPGLSDSSHAVFLHWRHSVLQESTFMSPWAAIEVAFDLAAELGTSSRIRVDEITFSSTTSCRKQVSFDANVLVFQGKESGKFHPHWTCINDRPARQVPQAPRGEDSGRSATSPQGQGSSAGSTQTTHFLDRRLPDEVPGYVHHLQHLWRDELIRLPPGQPYRVRSWYIYHTHQQVWKTPRYIDLHGDGTFWHRDLLVQWRDQLHNDEVLNIAVVFPALRALQHTHPVHADLILVQGGLNYCGGLTTVFPPGAHADASYTWAASYPRHVGGVGILAGVDAENYLQAHVCDVFHGGITIPTTNAPSHWMSNGHSFVAVFQGMQGRVEIEELFPNSPTTYQAVPVQAPPATTVSSSEEAHFIEEDAEESPPLEESSFDEEDLQGVQVYQIGRPMHHCFLRWRTYNLVLFDMVHSIGLHRDLAVGYHRMLAHLVDQHPSEEVVILQRVGDIPLASTAKLVLLDLTYATPSLGPGDGMRDVRLLPPRLTRMGLLQTLRLQDDCVSPHGDHCRVFLNNVLWPFSDTGARDLQHGSYLRIQLSQDHERAQVAQASKRQKTSCGLSNEQSSLRQRSGPSSGSAHGPGDTASFFQVQSVTTADMTQFDAKMFQYSATSSSLAMTHRPATQRGPPRVRPQQTNSREWLPKHVWLFENVHYILPQNNSPC